MFHGIDRVHETKPDIPVSINPRVCALWATTNGSCAMSDILGDYDWSELRYSISWKGYCFKDEAEEALWRSGSDDLSISFILNLEEDLRAKSALTGDRPDPTAFATMMVGHYIRFPRLQAAAE